MSSPEAPVFEPAPIDFSMIASLEPEAAVRTLIQHGLNMRASDLFLLADEGSVQVAARWLGAMQMLGIVPKDLGRRMVGFVKSLAEMDIAEHRRPLDGRLVYRLEDGRSVDLRVNIVPTLHGLDVTMRLLDRELGLRSIDQLGMTRPQLGHMKATLASPSGLILVTGPTGSGKTTTLYSFLQHLRSGHRKINTLEDPVEFALAGVRQSQINPKIGVDFPDLLRSVLRQAPDIIMVGEIRDEETARTAVRAAGSGHLVIATLHAPVAAGAIQSMLALGAPPYFLANSLVGVVAQRLVRTLCPNCRAPIDISAAPEMFAEVRSLLTQGEGKTIYGPQGCDRCLNVGYSDRTALFEVLTLNPTIRRLIAESRPSAEIQAKAIEHGMVEFRRGALLKVAQGVTSAEEIMNEVPADTLGLE